MNENADERLRPETGDRSVGELLRQMTEHSRELIHQEVELAKREGRENVDRLRRGAIWLGLAVGPALVGLLCLALAAIDGLAQAIPEWASALIVGAVLLVAAGGMGALAYRRLQQAEVPPRTVQALEDDQTWIREKVT
ncbi:MAG: phage holin family protein [Myxococcota bacterium]